MTLAAWLTEANVVTAAVFDARHLRFGGLLQFKRPILGH